jgi:hypothetical protein
MEKIKVKTTGEVKVDLVSTTSTTQEPSMRVITVPNYAGMYCLGGKNGFCISFEKKPNFFHRTMMKVCLGWEWKDKK